MQHVELKLEREYYLELSNTLATYIRTLGIVVTTIFSFGAMIGAMITMYAAVANRTVEVGTLRALGFRRRSVLGAFLVESVMLALVGGVLGVALAALLSFERISVVNFQSFSEIGFALSPGVIVRALVFAVVMGEPDPDLRETLEVDDRNPQRAAGVVAGEARAVKLTPLAAHTPEAVRAALAARGWETQPAWFAATGMQALVVLLGEITEAEREALVRWGAKGGADLLTGEGGALGGAPPRPLPP